VPGMYNVCLTINDGSCTDTYCAMVQADTSVIVNPGCQAFFATVQLAPYQLAVVNFSSGMNLSFTWDFGDGSTSNQAYPSHQYASTGSYNLCLTVADNNGCSDTYCDTISVDSMGYIFRSLPGFTISVVSPAALAAGINDDIQPLRFTAYPNPVSNMLTIERDANAYGTASYRIYTLQGAAVMSGNLEAATTNIQLGQLANGAYLLEVMESNGFRSFRNLIKY
jgi:PKD repeat protein